jgi:hypothetical protein
VSRDARGAPLHVELGASLSLAAALEVVTDEVSREPVGMDNDGNYDGVDHHDVAGGELSEFDDMVSAALGGGKFPRCGGSVKRGSCHRALLGL